jgi:hypothetical protein
MATWKLLHNFYEDSILYASVMIPMLLHKEYFFSVTREYYTSCHDSVEVLKKYTVLGIGAAILSNTKYS